MNTPWSLAWNHSGRQNDREGLVMSYWWQDRAWRTIHTNLREIDMADIDAEAYVEQMKSFHVNTVIINTAGIIANYDTKLPYHFKNPYLTGDSLQKVVELCRKAGMRIISRVDFSKVRTPVYENHPEWAFVNTKGEIIDYHGNIHVCFNSDYQQKYALEIMREVMDVINPDGFFLNMGEYAVGYDYTRGWQGICQCDNCRRRFYDMFHEKLPTVEDYDDPVYQDYRVFQKRTVDEYYNNIKSMIARVRPDVLFYHMLNTDMLRVEIGTSIRDKDHNYLYSGSERLKVEKGSYPHKVCGEVSVDAIDMIYRYTSVSPHQLELRMAQSLANGAFVDFYLNGRLDNHPNRSGFEPLKRMYAYHEAHEEDYYARSSVVKMALVKPKVNSFEKSQVNMHEYFGWYNLLTQEHYLFDCIEADALANAMYDKYRTIILPDIHDMSDEDTERLDRFVRDGGMVIATGQTAHYNERHERRIRVGLDSLGIKQVGLASGGILSAYFKLEDKTDYPRFADTDYVYLRDLYCYAEYEETAKKHLKLIPPHRHAPPEQAYPTSITEFPAFTVNTYGSGTGVYIPWRPGNEYYEFGFNNIGDFLADILKNVLSQESVEGNLPPTVEIAHTEREATGIQYVHLVNDSGYFCGSFFEPHKMYDLYADIPWNKKTPERVYSMVREQDVRFEMRGDRLRLYVDELGMFEGLKIT